MMEHKRSSSVGTLIGGDLGAIIGSIINGRDVVYVDIHGKSLQEKTSILINILQTGKP
jgi:hypothetical protein